MPTRSRARRPGGPIYLATIDRRSRVPLHEQLRLQLRRAIEERRLTPGAPLPSSRALAADLSVSRATVVLAYEHLRAEGWVEGPSRGTTRVAASPEWGPAPGAASPDGAARQAALSARGRAILATQGQPALFERMHDVPRPFAPAQPAVDLSPTDLWGRLLSKRWRRTAVRALGYGDPRGLPELRVATAAYLARARGVVCTPDQIVITQGAQQAIDMLARVLLDPGDAVWMEEPGYPGARLAFAAAGARVVPVPVDDEGLRVDEALRRAADGRLAFVTPARQMPLGGVMSTPRRDALLAWASGDARRWIVEDDYDSEFRYATRQTSALQPLDRSGSVVHLGTFTKALFPALRLGYAVVPAALVDAVAAAKRAMDFASPYLEQAVMADFISEGHFDRHIRRLRTAYRARLDALERAAGRELDGLAVLAPSDAGRAVLLWLAPGIDEAGAVSAAEDEGLSVTPYSAFCIDPDPRQGLILGYGGLGERAIRDGVARLARALGRCATGTSPAGKRRARGAAGPAG